MKDNLRDAFLSFISGLLTGVVWFIFLFVMSDFSGFGVRVVSAASSILWSAVFGYSLAKNRRQEAAPLPIFAGWVLSLPLTPWSYILALPDVGMGVTKPWLIVLCITSVFTGVLSTLFAPQLRAIGQRRVR